MIRRQDSSVLSGHDCWLKCGLCLKTEIELDADLTMVHLRADATRNLLSINAYVVFEECIHSGDLSHSDPIMCNGSLRQPLNAQTVILNDICQMS